MYLHAPPFLPSCSHPSTDNSHWVFPVVTMMTADSLQNEDGVPSVTDTIAVSCTSTAPSSHLHPNKGSVQGRCLSPGAALTLVGAAWSWSCLQAQERSWQSLSAQRKGFLEVITNFFFYALSTRTFISEEENKENNSKKKKLFQNPDTHNKETILTAFTNSQRKTNQMDTHL